MSHSGCLASQALMCCRLAAQISAGLPALQPPLLQWCRPKSVPLSATAGLQLQALLLCKPDVTDCACPQPPLAALVWFEGEPWWRKCPLLPVRLVRPPRVGPVTCGMVMTYWDGMRQLDPAGGAPMNDSREMPAATRTREQDTGPRGLAKMLVRSVTQLATVVPPKASQQGPLRASP